MSRKIQRKRSSSQKAISATNDIHKQEIAGNNSGSGCSNKVPANDTNLQAFDELDLGDLSAADAASTAVDDVHPSVDEEIEDNAQFVEKNKIKDSIKSKTSKPKKTKKNKDKPQKNEVEEDEEQINLSPAKLKKMENLLKDGREEAKKELEEEKGKVMKNVPLCIQEMWGEIGFAKWGKTFLPALNLNPYDAPPGEVRDLWWQMYKKMMENHRPLENMAYLVYWYGEENPHNFYSIVANKSFVLHKEASGKMLGFANAAIKKKDAKKDLTPDDQQKLRGWSELQEDLNKPAKDRKRGIVDFKERHELLTIRDVLDIYDSGEETDEESKMKTPQKTSTKTTAKKIASTVADNHLDEQATELMEDEESYDADENGHDEGEFSAEKAHKKKASTSEISSVTSGTANTVSVVKKKRGRPPKENKPKENKKRGRPKSVATPETLKEDEDGGAVKEKRGRGRPRSVATPETLKEVKDSGPVNEKRGRGRPKAVATPETLREVADGGPVKKKRGRPRSVAKPETSREVEDGEPVKKKRGRPRSVAKILREVEDSDEKSTTSNSNEHKRSKIETISDVEEGTMDVGQERKRVKEKKSEDDRVGSGEMVEEEEATAAENRKTRRKAVDQIVQEECGQDEDEEGEAETQMVDDGAISAKTKKQRKNNELIKEDREGKRTSNHVSNSGDTGGFLENSVEEYSIDVLRRRFEADEEAYIDLLGNWRDAIIQNKGRTIQMVLVRIMNKLNESPMCSPFIEKYQFHFKLKDSKSILKEQGETLEVFQKLKEKIKNQYNTFRKRVPSEFEPEVQYLDLANPIIRPELAVGIKKDGDNKNKEESSKEELSASQESGETVENLRNSIAESSSNKIVSKNDEKLKETSEGEKPQNGGCVSVALEKAKEPMRDGSDEINPVLTEKNEEIDDETRPKVEISDSANGKDAGQTHSTLITSKNNHSGDVSQENPKIEKKSARKIKLSKGFSLGSFTKQSRDSNTNATAVERRVSKKKQIPDWASDPSTIELPSDPDRLLGLQYLRQMALQFPEDKVNAESFARSVEDALCRRSNRGMDDGKKTEYWDRLHSVIAGVCGESEPGPLMHLILNGEVHSADMLVGMDDVQYAHSFKGKHVLFEGKKTV